MVCTEFMKSPNQREHLQGHSNSENDTATMVCLHASVKLQFTSMSVQTVYGPCSLKSDSERALSHDERPSLEAQEQQSQRVSGV